MIRELELSALKIVAPMVSREEQHSINLGAENVLVIRGSVLKSISDNAQPCIVLSK
jgi:hypothetical protein